MEKYIHLSYRDKQVDIPNAWEVLTSAQYLKLVGYLLQLDHGEIDPWVLKVRFLCDLLDLDIRRFRKEEDAEALASVSDRITFLFHETDTKIELNLCFCHQLLPMVEVEGKQFGGYEVSTAFQSLTCSLTALQYIEARQTLEMGEASYPLLAAILYYPGEYSSEGAQKLARTFESLPKVTLQAIALNFTAINNFLFTKTEFSLLTKFRDSKKAAITTDASDALYDLSKDGLGNVLQVERMNVLTYLRILRKKTIDGVKELKAAGMDVAKIANTVGLPLEIIKQIV